MNGNNIALRDFIKVEVAKPGQQVITQQAFVQPPRPFVRLCEGQVPFGDELRQGRGTPACGPLLDRVLAKGDAGKEPSSKLASLLDRQVRLTRRYRRRARESGARRCAATTSSSRRLTDRG